jgi:catechol 2,3-dioxygenase-like lactoylglutathione lyase family enzyme
MAMAGVRFGHVAFKVSDVEQSVRWYGDAFGAKKVFHVKPEGERPELMFLEFARGQFVEFFTNGKNKVEQPPDPVGYLHFCLRRRFGLSAQPPRRDERKTGSRSVHRARTTTHSFYF